MLRSLMRSCSRGMAQTRVVVGAGPIGGLPGNDDRGKDVRVLEDLLGVAEIDDRFDPGILGEEPPQRLAVGGLEPFVRDDERKPAAWLQHPHPEFVEINVEIGRAVERFESLLKVGLVGGNPLLADIGRIADDDVETALLEHLRERRPASRRPWDGRP